MSDIVLPRVAFFDLGDTLIFKGERRRWVPGAKRTLEALHAKGLRLGIISNTGDWTVEQIEALLPEDFDTSLFESTLVHYSSQIGFEKPDPRIFEGAINAAGVSPDACWFCTECARDTIVSQLTGMRAYRLSRNTERDYETLMSQLLSLTLGP